MGYICEQLKFNQTIIDDRLAEMFLAGIIVGLRER